MSEEIELWVTSLYGHKTKKPLVELHWKDISIQMETAKAREVALMLLEGAEAADQDGFLVEWAQSEAGTTAEGAARLLAEFRKWRDMRKE